MTATLNLEPARPGCTECDGMIGLVALFGPCDDCRAAYAPLVVPAA